MFKIFSKNFITPPREAVYSADMMKLSHSKNLFGFFFSKENFHISILNQCNSFHLSKIVNEIHHPAQRKSKLQLYFTDLRIKWSKPFTNHWNTKELN